MKKTIDLRRNADGTVTAVYGTDRTTFTVEPWYSEVEVYDHAKWAFISLGVDIDHANEMKTGIEEETNGTEENQERKIHDQDKG